MEQCGGWSALNAEERKMRTNHWYREEQRVWGAFVRRSLANGTPIMGRSKYRPAQTHDIWKDYSSKTRPSFQAPGKEELPPMVIIADGKRARILNTVTLEVSEPMTRPEAQEFLTSLEQTQIEISQRTN